MEHFLTAKFLKHLNLRICEFYNKTNNKTAVTHIYSMWKVLLL